MQKENLACSMRVTLEELLLCGWRVKKEFDLEGYTLFKKRRGKGVLLHNKSGQIAYIYNDFGPIRIVKGCVARDSPCESRYPQPYFFTLFYSGKNCSISRTRGKNQYLGHCVGLHRVYKE